VTAARTSRRKHASELARSNAVRFALGRQIAWLTEVESFADERGGALPDKHLARRRRLLEPRRDVHGVAGRERAPLAGPSDDDLARVHPNPQREAVGKDVPQAVEHPQRRLQRPLCVILLCARGTEDRDDRIADELLDRAAAERDLSFHRVVKTLQEISRVLGIEFVAERGGADEIGEQDRRQLPLHARG
jgi:hypothetical protein